MNERNNLSYKIYIIHYPVRLVVNYDLYVPLAPSPASSAVSKFSSP